MVKKIKRARKKPKAAIQKVAVSLNPQYFTGLPHSLMILPLLFFLCYTFNNAVPTLQTRDAKKIKGNIMEKADRDFLVRADRVSENYQHRIRQLTETIADTALSASRWADIVQLLERCQRLEALRAEHEAHTARLKKLREQRHHEQAINKLCAEANKLAGTDGANFFTQAGKIFDNQQEKTPHE